MPALVLVLVGDFVLALVLVLLVIPVPMLVHVVARVLVFAWVLVLVGVPVCAVQQVLGLLAWVLLRWLLAIAHLWCPSLLVLPLVGVVVLVVVLVCSFSSSCCGKGRGWCWWCAWWTLSGLVGECY